MVKVSANEMVPDESPEKSTIVGSGQEEHLLAPHHQQTEHVNGQFVDDLNPSSFQRSEVGQRVPKPEVEKVLPRRLELRPNFGRICGHSRPLVHESSHVMLAERAAAGRRGAF
jgi:hypothetical protein